MRIELGPNVADTPLLLWPSLHCTFEQALVSLLGPDALIDSGRFEHEGRTLIFGNAPPTRGALRVTFDGWIAKVGPAANIDALPQREYCSLSGVLAGALAISELFLSFADLNIEAGRRIVALSLWRARSRCQRSGGAWCAGLGARYARTSRNYSALDLAGLNFCDAGLA